MTLYDEKNNLVAKIDRNEWISGDSLPWDIESRYQWLKIRHQIGNIQLEIDATEFPIKIIADIWKNGNNFKINSENIVISGLSGKIQDIFFRNSHIDGVVTIDTLKNTMTIGRRKNSSE